MKRWIIAAAAFCVFTRAAVAQTNGDIHDFELTPVAPPVPMLKYELQFNMSERHPGNGAIMYLNAISLVNSEVSKQISDADDAYYLKKSNFHSLATALNFPSVFNFLDFGSRCDDCDWQVPVREQGINALLPHLNGDRALAEFLELRAIGLAQNGKFDEALADLRIGYSFARNVGKSPMLVSGLVATGMAALTDQGMMEVMNQPESPNLYWALASLPHPMFHIASNWEVERMFIPATLPELSAKNIDRLSGDEWRGVFKKMVDINSTPGSKQAPSLSGWENSQTVIDEVKSTLPQAQDEYAKLHGVAADEVEKMDPFKVVCTFWYQEYVNTLDEESAILSLPYPVMVPKLDEMNARVIQLKSREPVNVFLSMIPSIQKAALTYAKAERTRAAMTDVEAIRSFAAAHQGKLPDALEQITDTPPLENPRTGKAFDYKVDGDKATISDAGPDGFPLTYTVRIRK
jgi:hypothetical protein